MHTRRFASYITCDMFTSDPGIFMMSAVVDSPSQTSTSFQGILASSAIHIVHQNITRTLSEGSIREVICLTQESQTTTDHLGVVSIEVIIADCSPGAVMLHLDSTFIATVSSYQTDVN